MGTTSQHGAAPGTATHRVCPGLQPQGGSDEPGVKIKLQHGRCRAQAAIPRAREVFGTPKGMQRPLHLPRELQRSATGTDNRKMGAASLPPAHGRDQEGIPLLPAEAGRLAATKHQGRCQEPTNLSFFPQLSQGKAAGVQGSWHNLAPHAAVLCHPADFPLPSPLPYRLSGRSQCHDRQRIGWLETHFWQGNSRPSFQRGNNSQLPPFAAAAVFHRAPHLSPGDRP